MQSQKIFSSGEEVRCLLQWFMQLHSSIKGGELSDLSFQMFAQEEIIKSEDYMPAGGYSSLLKAMFE
jgi:hypothetical protein